MTDFIMFAGPNGSGKSSARDAIVNPVEVVIDPDRIAREINPSAPRSVDNPAAREALRRFDQSIAQGKSISMETTLTGHTAVMRLQQAKDAGYAVGLIYVALNDPELNVLRVEERVRRGGHGIAPDVVRKRVGTSLANLPRALAIADQAVVLDNSGKQHQRIMEVAAGQVTYLAEQLPDWLTQQMPTILASLKARTGAATEQALEPTAGARPSLVSSVFSALRRPETEAAAPWTTPPVPMAERLAVFERAAAETARKKAGAAEPEPEGDAPPKPSKGPKP